MQNLPSRDKDKKALKNAVLAPEGHIIINCDSSQIEARVLAWLAGQQDVVSQFANGEDVYSTFASKIYNRRISKADPVERFVGKTCVLGLGYGTGAEKLRHTLKTSPPGADLPVETCKQYVDLYREVNHHIVDLWHECDQALRTLMTGVKKPFFIGKNSALCLLSEGIRLPNGLFIRYPDLRLEDGKMVYTSRRGANNIWGGAVVENVVQALARIIVGEQMVKLKYAGYPPVLTVHDAAVCIVHEDEVDTALATITNIMSTPPAWAARLPVACEAKFGHSYGDC